MTRCTDQLPSDEIAGIWHFQSHHYASLRHTDWPAIRKSAPSKESTSYSVRGQRENLVEAAELFGVVLCISRIVPAGKKSVQITLRTTTKRKFEKLVCTWGELLAH
jgi:hypothetical protein